MLENVLDKGLKFFLRNGSSNPLFAKFRRLLAVPSGFRRGFGLPGMVIVATFCLGLASGCSHLRPKPSKQYVYVTAKQTFLRDRVAAVSNRTGTVQNGDKLEVLERGRRFLHVKTDSGTVGWIEESKVATQDIFDSFQALAQTHKGDPTVASAVVRDEVNVHLKPGRETPTFYRLAEGDKLQLLDRATLPKPVPGGALPAKTAAKAKTSAPQADSAAAEPPPPIAMEDWWLFRDSRGRAGWLLSRMLEVDAPDTLTRYAEGQRFVGAYVLTTVYDPGAEQADKNIPIYLTVLSPYLAGLPYDFDQVRIFTWNVKMHRYETAYRERNIEGYLPLSIRMSKDPYGKSPTAQAPLPTFSYKVLAADAGPVVPDPITGMVTPGHTIEKTYRLEGNIVRRIQPPGSPKDELAHPAPEVKKEKGGKKKR